MNKLFNIIIALAFVTNAFSQSTMNIYQDNGTILQIPLSSIDSITYTITGATLPTLTTTVVSAITNTTATSGGNITNDGGATVSERGICWSTSNNPTIADNHISNGTGIGSFTNNLTGLAVGTIYYVRAYATNNNGTAYGNQQNFTTTGVSIFTPGGGVTDFEGNNYSTVILGTQEWMAENLKTKRYRNGEFIPDGTGVGNISGQTEPKYWFMYNDNVTNMNEYGLLYTWYTLTDSRHLCPTNWHEPTDDEWTILINYLGGDSVAGGKLKEVGFTHWNSPNVGAENSSGFTALASGYRSYGGGFAYLKTAVFFMSTTEQSSLKVWYRTINCDYNWVNRNSGLLKQDGLSVRCVKD